MVRCKKFFPSCLLFLVYAIVTLSTVLVSGYAHGSGNDTGKKSFERYCAVCHGVKGDANGRVCFNKSFEENGRAVDVTPRDFTLGVFKFRSTSTGCLPTDNDLISMVNNGIAKSFMPSFRDIPLQDKRDLIGYIKTFSTRWKEDEPCKPISVKKPEWVGRPNSVDQGKQVYKDMKCWECHGEEGKGDGTKSDKLKDDQGKPIVPFDFTTSKMRRGTSPENIYITFTTGLDGTGMPSYEDSLKDEDRWHLVSYTLKLMKLVK